MARGVPPSAFCVGRERTDGKLDFYAVTRDIEALPTYAWAASIAARLNAADRAGTVHELVGDTELHYAGPWRVYAWHFDPAAPPVAQPAPARSPRASRRPS